MPQAGNLACNPGMCPDWELNQLPFVLQASIYWVTPARAQIDNIFDTIPWHPFYLSMTLWPFWSQSETLTAEEGEKKENPEVQAAAAHSPLSTQISDPDDFTGLETSILLQHGDTVLHISEENGMENPLLSSQYTFTPTELGEIRVDLDESHV